MDQSSSWSCLGTIGEVYAASGELHQAAITHKPQKPDALHDIPKAPLQSWI